VQSPAPRRVIDPDRRKRLGPRRGSIGFGRDLIRPIAKWRFKDTPESFQLRAAVNEVVGAERRHTQFVGCFKRMSYVELKRDSAPLVDRFYGGSRPMCKGPQG
jgi:hypothetical protein